MEKAGGTSRAGLAGACLIAACMAALALVDPPFLREAGEICGDLIQRLTLPSPPGRASVIVAADEKSAREVGPWPWPDGTAGRLVELISRGKPRAIGLASCPASSGGGRALADAVRAAGNIAAGFSAGRPGRSSKPPPPAPANARFRYVTNPWGKARAYEMPEGEGAECLDSPLSEAAGAGFLNAFQSGRGPVREAALVCLDAGGYYRGFAVALACIATGAERVTLRLKGDAVEGIEFGGRLVPTDRRGMLRLRPCAVGPEIIPAADVLLGNADPKRWAGRIVLVGECEAAPARVIGRRPPSAPAVVLQADALDAILSGNYLRRTRFAAGLEVVLAALFPFIARRAFGGTGGGPGWILFAAALAVCAGATAAFLRMGGDFRPFYPAASAVVSCAAFGTMRARSLRGAD